MQLRDFEIVFNLWYMRDEAGFIYSLRAKPYVAWGGDRDLWRFLETREYMDYHIAREFEIPERFRVTVATPVGMKMLSATHRDGFSSKQSLVGLFADALDVLTADFPKKDTLSLTDEPAVYLTARTRDDRGCVLKKESEGVRYQWHHRGELDPNGSLPLGWRSLCAEGPVSVVPL